MGFRILAGGTEKQGRSGRITGWTSTTDRETTSELRRDHRGTSANLCASLPACGQYRRDFAIKSGAASAHTNGSGTPVTIPCCDSSLRSKSIRGVSFFAWS